MFRALASLGLVATGLFVVGCERPCKDCSLTELEWDLVKGMSPLPASPDDPTNKFQRDEPAAALGYKLVFDARYSGALKVGNVMNAGGPTGSLGNIGETGKVACVSCHDPKNYFVDMRSKIGNVSVGAAFTARNAPSLVNLPFYTWWGLAGRHDSMWQQAGLSVETPTDTTADRCTFSRFIFANYREQYELTFPGEVLPIELGDTSTTTGLKFPLSCRPKANMMAPDGNWEKMAPEDKTAVLTILSHTGKAIAAYETQLISGNAAFDRYVAGDETAINAKAKRGLHLFVGKAACVDCHSGAFFSDGKFHNVGCPQVGPNVPSEDLGRFTEIGIYKKHPFNSSSAFNDKPELNRVATTDDAVDADKGLFRTPTLRNVEKTAPYMHDGTFATLQDVVWFYNEGGGASAYSGAKSPPIKPLDLTDTEVEDLVEFLKSLTGEPLPDSLTANPFVTQ